VLGAIIGLFGVEVTLRVLMNPQLSLLVHTRTPGVRTVLRPDPKLMPGVSGESVVQYNDRGIRGGPIPSDRSVYRILCVGGSTTECLYLDDNETWPHVMMEDLNARTGSAKVWVGNVGISGFSTLNHLRFVQESNLPKEMDCLVFLVGANDFLKHLSGRLREEAFSPIWVKSSCWGLIIRSWAAIRLRQGRSELDTEDVEGKIYVTRRAVRQRAIKTDEQPDMSEALAGYRERLREIIKRCRAMNVRCIFLTQPMVWNSSLSKEFESLLWLGGLRDGRFVTQSRLRDGIEAYNRTLKETCAENKVECVDLSPISGREELFYDDAHFNELGAREVARLVAIQVATKMPASLIAPGEISTPVHGDRP
jgi:lysophospholipase L1-like esterase